MGTSAKNIDGRTAALTTLAFVLLVALALAWRIDAEATTQPPDAVYTLTVVDEAGVPIPGATITADRQRWATDETGRLTVELKSPELFIAAAEGMVPDAVVLGSPQAPDSTLRLLARSGDGGDRIVMHFAGDFMMGRRYLEPPPDRTPMVTDEASARAVVSDIAPLFGLADLVSVNYESVAGTLSPNDAYAGKRFLLQSPPETMAALDELGVDVATLGNNHVNDWMEAGIASTVRHLDAAGIAHPGGGTTAADALEPAIIDTGVLQVGVVSMTTVTGDYVNDGLPDTTAPPPAALRDADRWQYETRTFGFGSPGRPNYIPTADRRPGEMWAEFRQLESNLSGGDAADLWLSISRTYPELQDWVARRGHGGAAHFSREAVQDSIATARREGADLVVVQLHGGLQFAEVASEYFRSAARAAVDAGADLVIGHHPHVLQGFEFYEGKLIAHSLGNFVFDQDFLVTHPSVVLRTVFEGTELLEAKLYPVMLDNYRPVPVTGDTASLILDGVNLASLQTAQSTRLPDRRVGSTLSPDSDQPTARIRRITGQGIVVRNGQTATTSVSVPATTPIKPETRLGMLTGEVDGVLIGRDLFGFGDLEDVQADGRNEGGLEWFLPGDSLEIDETSPAGSWTVRLDRTSQDLDETIARTAARLPLPAHRWFNDAGQPVDGTATYSIHVWAKRTGAGIPFVRVAFYEFDDTDPTRAPQSTTVDTVDIELPLVNDVEWHELWVDLPVPPVDANAALVGIGMSPPESKSGTMWLDGFEVIEWRRADQIPAGTWAPIDWLLAPAARSVTVVTP